MRGPRWARLRAFPEWERGFLQATADTAAWVIGLTFAYVTRLDFHPTLVDWRAVLWFAVLASVGQVVVGTASYLYRGRFRFGGFDEVAALARVVAAVVMLLLCTDLTLDPRPIPASVPFAGGMAALLTMCGMRYLWRLALDRRARRTKTERTLVFGAGEAGQQLVSSMLHDPVSRFLPVALLDDDPGRRNLRVSGVPVRGNRWSIPWVAGQAGVTTLVIAVPSAHATLMREVSTLAHDVGLAVKVLPGLDALLSPRPHVNDVRDLDLADVLGRRQIDTDLDSIAGYLTGKRVLVTGAGGSIGSELCRQIHRFAPARLVMLDRDESALHSLQLAIDGRALLDSPDLVLADLRDTARIQQVFRDHRPEVVFHAAALKHLPLLEAYPGEAVMTNVWGTLTVLEAAAAHGVQRFVNISTDKAVRPTSVLGYSKRITERLTAHVAGYASGTYLSVRFGNVLGSRGSVLTAFTEQVAEGGPVTVTHPGVTRFFMTVQEAVQLVVQAVGIGRRGEALVLDMGEPVHIADVARQLAAQAPRPVEIVYTGLRPGEKLHEELFGAGEPDSRPIHPLISHVLVPPLSADQVLDLDPRGVRETMVAHLRMLTDASVPVGPEPTAVEPSEPEPNLEVLGGHDRLALYPVGSGASDRGGEL
ncbi:MAG: polysaccharide biosynthesis protein [Carbonactinosporaceae bacterium]